MSSSSQQAEVDVLQHDTDEELENISSDCSDTISKEYGELSHREAEVPPSQDTQHGDADSIPETPEESMAPPSTCDEPEDHSNTNFEMAALNHDVMETISCVSEEDGQPGVDELGGPEQSRVAVSGIQSAENSEDDEVHERTDSTKLDIQGTLDLGGVIESESNVLGIPETDILPLKPVGVDDMSVEDASCDSVVPSQQEDVGDGHILIDSDPPIPDYEESRPISVDIAISSRSSLAPPSESEDVTELVATAEEWGAPICLEEEGAVPCDTETQHGNDEKVQVAGQGVQLNEGVSKVGLEISEEPDVQQPLEPSASEAEDASENSYQVTSVDEPRATIPNADKLTPPVSPIILKAKRNEDADFLAEHPLLKNDSNGANTDDLRKHVALSIPTNKVAASFLKAQARMTQVQEEEKGGYLSKSFWTSTVLAFRRLREWFEGISLWSDRIQAVEGKHGSNVSLILYFLRWTLLLNILLLLLWVGMAVLPFIVHPPQSFSWDIFTESTASELLQGYGLDRTWFLYGGYNYPTGARFGGWYWYQPEIAFPFAIAGMYGASFFAVLYVIWSRMSGSGDASTIEQNQTYPFSSVVFASWDFHLRHKSAARTLQNAIRKQIGEMLQDATWDEMRLTLSQKVMKGMTKIIGTLVFWPMTVALTAAALYYIIDEGEVLNEYFGTGFAQSIAITLVTMISQIAVRSTVKYEGWHPRIKQQVEAMKLFSVKAVNLGVILYQLYSIQKQATEASSSLSQQLGSVVESESEGLEIVASSLAANLTESVRQLDVCDWTLETDACKRGFTCCHESCTTMLGSQSLQGRCVPVCEENEMGLIFYRLIMTNGIIISFQEVVTTFFMSRILKRPPEMDGSKFFVNIIETQALVWLGSPSAPLLPFFGVLSNLLTFYIKTWMALKLYNPPSNTCSASRNSNILYTLMLVTLLLCSLPMSTMFSRERDICGPHKGRTMAWAVSDKVRNAPNWIKSVIYWITNPMILGGLVMLLLFSLLFQVALKNRWRKNARDYKGEFTKYRRDMQAKMVESRRTTNRNTPAASMNSSFVSARQILKDTKVEIRTAESYTPLKPKAKRK